MTKEEAIKDIDENILPLVGGKSLRMAIDALRQPERKTGRWEIYVISMIDGEGCRCSECGFEGAPYWDFCPNCGSYNGGEQDEHNH